MPPAWNTGRYNVAPLVNCFRSRLPPNTLGGRELTGEDEAGEDGGATAIIPINGCSGTSIPDLNRATLRLRSSLMMRAIGSESRSGRTPVPLPEAFAP